MTIRGLLGIIWISTVTGTAFLADFGFAQTSQGHGSYITTATVNVRKGPGTEHEKVAKIPKGTKVQVVGKEGLWLKVQSKHGNPPGYIQQTYAKHLPAGKR